MPPIHDLTDAQLSNIMLALQLACGRSKSSVARHRRDWFCFAFESFKVEADLRGLPAPTPPYHVGDLPKNAV